ncbi:hypothetical protein GLOIN_2v1886405 [Rhizophagus irregularis DAOM 181602=DAOM 197198]|uniref:Uncharacterized protein n=1 Tax=Rhizophagus irregularis (strain DAOM 181602 / DAOM 197198 / MUCL 43194) TaxID=747089 RepID=A0A2P4NX28_RHIID|nr:hypothetical protein GLOIN_2v1886405 [Rhizophagus irregularis DAOM 181602=DAOM 197198]POG57658.1 hypothetical protein GLOIN_2v1886405 [Rhizophagus irregularis DAOM 181602=DAOM 197198]|eukprot:XP_025164524.1 hypothetical protein GLOIN_2v1886405 [Rhizophagus irregularis DAOM 181602=DAOM 197198]
MYQLRFLRFGSIPAYLDQILDLVSVSSALGYGTGSFGIGLQTLTSWTSLVGFLNIEQHLDFFFCRSASWNIFSWNDKCLWTFRTKGTP